MEACNHRATGRVLGFTEKAGRNIPGLINAGVYVFNHSIFEHLAQGPSSLERELFPRLLKHGIYAFQERGIFIDIGTPDSYARARAGNLRSTLRRGATAARVRLWRGKQKCLFESRHRCGLVLPAAELMYPLFRSARVAMC